MVPATVLCFAGVVAVAGLDPGLVRGLVEEAGAAAWLRPLCTLVRLSAGPAAGPCPVRVTCATIGRDLQWLVHTGGTICCDAVARGVGRAVGAAITAAPVEA